MTLEELNELLNIFEMYIVVKNKDVYFYDTNNTQLDVYQLTTDWDKIYEEKSSSIFNLFKGYVFKVIKDDIIYEFQIKYDYNLNIYSFRNLFIHDNKNNVVKIIKIADDPSSKSIEYFVSYNNNNYSYNAVFTKSKDVDWKEAYFDELDLNKLKIANKYSVDGNKDNYEISQNEFDYTKLYKLDPTISKIINYFDSSICDLLPDLPKIYGLYWPKNFNGGKPFEFENEYSLYHDMNRLYGNYSWNLIIDKEKTEESPFSYCIDYKDNEYIIENMIYYTKRFGVSLAEPQEGKHIVCAESLAWYKYFNDYFENILNHGQRDYLGNIIDSFVEEGKDISKYMPKGDWHDLLETDYYLFEILLGHDLNNLKEQAKKEDRIEDLVKAFYQLNNMDLGTLAFKFGPTPYLTNLFEHDYRPADEELDDLVYKLIINKTKIHGEYCTDDIFTDKDVLHIKYLSEPELYNVIKHYNDWKEISYEDFDRWEINKSYTDEDILYAKEFLMYQTKRFGVEFKANYENIPIEESQSYKAWYEFYDNYYNKFSDYYRDKMIENISFKRAENEDFKELIPDGDWHDLLNIKETDKFVKKIKKK